MKSAFRFSAFAFALALAALATTGCPVGTPYAPGDPGTEKIDKALLGTWTALQDSAEMLKVLVEREDDFSYSVEVLEQSENYMMDGTSFRSWVTSLDSRNFIYSKPLDSEEDEDEYFLYHYELNGAGNLVIQDVGLLVNGVDSVTSTESFRQEISASLRMEGCLSKGFEYRKEN